ncbi:hypothetical protein F7725_009869 [Dissostichus mawsoni]|uniref:Uncharacterized protein n=1 Tax=Dissostichus mawsoni TaxID=36200 RepID=A0A7J5XMA9_DISMA|nr:hypothetical protein F7725_009869 [Dissostichus mawsoni]
MAFLDREEQDGLGRGEDFPCGRMKPSQKQQSNSSQNHKQEQRKDHQDWKEIAC